MMPSSSPWGLLLLIGLCCLLPSSLQDPQLHPYPPFSDMAPKLANLSFSLYNELAKESHGNILFSPVAIVIAMTMLSQEIQEKVQLQSLEEPDASSKADILKALQLYLDSFNQPDKWLQLITGSMLFLDSSLKHMLTWFTDDSKAYHSKAFSANFQNPEEAKKQINDYIEKATQGQIVDLIKDLDKDTVFALVNYIFFKGIWVDRVKAQRTVEADFYVDEETTIRVPMINRLGSFHLHREEELASWVLLQHYAGPAVAFLILPDEGKMQHLEERLTETHLSTILRVIRMRSASLKLPKLSISGTYSLEILLGKLGITHVFGNGSSLLGIPEQIPLNKSKAVHKAVLTINEDGTQPLRATFSKEEPQFRDLRITFNRPFLVIVKDESTSVNLFMGKIVNPMEK